MLRAAQRDIVKGGSNNHQIGPYQDRKDLFLSRLKSNVIKYAFVALNVN